MPIGGVGKTKNCCTTSPKQGNVQIERGTARPPVDNRQVERGSKGNTWDQFEKGCTKTATNNQVDRVSGAGRDRPKPL